MLTVNEETQFKVENVSKLEEGVYLINERVKVYEFDFNEEGVTFSLDWDDEVMTEEYATRLADVFVKEVLQLACEQATKI